jgi:hypothetical protein
VSLSRWNHRQRRKKAYGDKTAKKQFAKHDCPLFNTGPLPKDRTLTVGGLAPELAPRG